MGKLFTISSYLKYFFRAKNEHSLHSPFLFALYTQVIKPKKKYYAFETLEYLREEFLTDHRAIEVIDFGAGSKVSNAKKRKVSSIAKVSVSAQKKSELLFKLVNHFQPKYMIELGTSLGLNSLYLQSALPQASLWTFEGSPSLCQLAKGNFDRLRLSSKIIEGNIDETLPRKLDDLERLDFAFFDANHQFEPTIRYFEACLEKAHEDAVFVFDDIYWSAEMAKAWEKIKDHPSITISIDLFDVGIIFFRKKQPKQHFVLRY